jgi:FtsP/CotA-like multicopper oxidase with cupredoxin domain
MVKTVPYRLFTVAAAIALCASSAFASTLIPQTALPGKNVPKYGDPLPTRARVSSTSISVSMEEFQQKVLPASVYSALPGPFNAGTFVWGYNLNAGGPSYPARTIEAQRTVATTVTYTNNLVGPNGAAPVLQQFLTVDQTLHWADPLGLGCEFLTTPDQQAAGCFVPFVGPVAAVTHLHGAEVPSAFDGGPEQWFTPNGLHGAGYASLKNVRGNQAVYRYPNGQEATTLWFHDHALGSTRLNVFSGLAGFYFLRDSRDTGLATNSIHLPAGAQEVELLIQDRQFDTNGQLLFPDGNPSGLNGPPPNPEVHPFWSPEFFGDVIVVNGKSWPFLNVEPRRYRFRVLNGSNARMYDLAIRDGSTINTLAATTGSAATIWQIGADGGFLDAPAPIASPSRLFLAPGERADVIVDFSAFAGKTLILDNDAKAPFPSGAPADPQTVGQIMQFRVSKKAVADTTCNPASATNPCNLRATPIVRLASGGAVAPGVVVDKKRQLVLKEIEGPGGPLEVLLNNTLWSGLRESTLTDPVPIAIDDSQQVIDNFATELPRVGSTEVWEIINTTADAHPIHIHLIQFQVISRQPFQSAAYTTDWEAAGQFSAGFSPGNGPPFPYNTVNDDGAVGGNLAVSPYLQDGSTPPNPNEAGWKDTVVMKPGEVTRIVGRWAPQGIAVGGVAAGQNFYAFDPTALIGTKDFAGNPGGPGYVWHCHILDHEDNEMMRPYAVQP